jgi:hypothetical protein
VLDWKFNLVDPKCLDVSWTAEDAEAMQPQAILSLLARLRIDAANHSPGVRGQRGKTCDFAVGICTAAAALPRHFFPTVENSMIQKIAQGT